MWIGVEGKDVIPGYGTEVGVDLLPDFFGEVEVVGGGGEDVCSPGEGSEEGGFVWPMVEWRCADYTIVFCCVVTDVVRGCVL